MRGSPWSLSGWMDGWRKRGGNAEEWREEKARDGAGEPDDARPDSTSIAFLGCFGWKGADCGISFLSRSVSTSIALFGGIGSLA